MTSNDDWETPQEFYDRLDAEFHFTLDACATARNTKCTRFYTKRQNSLLQPWTGVVFCNPPYSELRTGEWTCKALMASKHGATVVMLLPPRTDTAYWHNHVMKADELRFVRGRIHFRHPRKKVSSPRDPNVVVIWRPGCAGPPCTSSMKR